MLARVRYLPDRNAVWAETEPFVTVFEAVATTESGPPSDLRMVDFSVVAPVHEVPRDDFPVIVVTVEVGLKAVTVQPAALAGAAPTANPPIIIAAASTPDLASLRLNLGALDSSVVVRIIVLLHPSLSELMRSIAVSL